MSIEIKPIQSWAANKALMSCVTVSKLFNLSEFYRSFSIKK